MFGHITKRKGCRMSKDRGIFEEKWLSQAGEKQYAIEAIQTLIDQAPNSVAEIIPETPVENVTRHIVGIAETGESTLTISRTELARLIEVSRNDVIYTEPIFSLLKSFKANAPGVDLYAREALSYAEGRGDLMVCDGDNLTGSQHAVFGGGPIVLSTPELIRKMLTEARIEKIVVDATATTDDRDAVTPSWYRIAGMIQSFAYILQDLETDYLDFLEFSRDADAQGVNDTYLMIAQNGVNQLSHIRHRLLTALGSVEGDGAFVKSELSSYCDMLSIYHDSARGLVGLARDHAQGVDSRWQTLGKLQGRLEYISGAFVWIVEGFRDTARRIMDAARREHGERLKKGDAPVQGE